MRRADGKWLPGRPRMPNLHHPAAALLTTRTEDRRDFIFESARQFCFRTQPGEDAMALPAGLVVAGARSQASGTFVA